MNKERTASIGVTGEEIIVVVGYFLDEREDAANNPSWRDHCAYIGT